MWVALSDPPVPVGVQTAQHTEERTPRHRERGPDAPTRVGAVGEGTGNLWAPKSSGDLSTVTSGRPGPRMGHWADDFRIK